MASRQMAQMNAWLACSSSSLRWGRGGKQVRRSPPPRVTPPACLSSPCVSPCPTLCFPLSHPVFPLVPPCVSPCHTLCFPLSHPVFPLGTPCVSPCDTLCFPCHTLCFPPVTPCVSSVTPCVSPCHTLCFPLSHPVFAFYLLANKAMCIPCL